MLEYEDIQHILLTRMPALTGRYEFLSFRTPGGARTWLSAISADDNLLARCHLMHVAQKMVRNLNPVRCLSGDIGPEKDSPVHPDNDKGVEQIEADGRDEE